jgi:multicomponent Na+:H+ antiporter subunit G
VNEIVSAVLLMIGSLFMLLAAAGVVRMPDLFTRMQTASKASTLGLSCMMLAVAAHFFELSVTTRSLAVIVFAFLTIPVASHMLGRAAYLSGVALWDKVVIDQLRGRYHRDTHELDSQVTTGEPYRTAAGLETRPYADDPPPPHDTPPPPPQASSG